MQYCLYLFGLFLIGNIKNNKGICYVTNTDTDPKSAFPCSENELYKTNFWHSKITGNIFKLNASNKITPQQQLKITKFRYMFSAEIIKFHFT